jgi:hypothetical protein
MTTTHDEGSTTPTNSSHTTAQAEILVVADADVPLALSTEAAAVLARIIRAQLGRRSPTRHRRRRERDCAP